MLFHQCAVLTWARTQKTRALSSAEAEGAAQLLQEWQRKAVPLLHRLTERICGAQAKRAWSDESYRNG